MFYTILPNPSYVISSKLKIKKVGMDKSDLVHIDKNNVKIELYGIEYTVDKKWLYDIAYHKISLPHECTHRITDIIFRDYGKNYGKEFSVNIATKEPIIYKGKYAIAPNYPGMAIDKEANVIDTHTGKIIMKPEVKYYKEYIIYNIHGRIFRVHRVMLEAWLWNDDVINKVIVNHIDGNKNNPVLSNLEWATYSDNIKHAYDNGLRTDNIPIRVKHHSSKKVEEYSSIGKFCSLIKTSRISSKKILKMPIGTLFSGYEIRLENDTRDWYYKNGDEPKIPASAKHQYIITINNEKFIRYSIKETNILLQLPKRTLLKNTIKYTNKNNISLKIKTLKTNKKYQYYRLKDNYISKAKSVKQMSKITGIGIGSIRRLLLEGEHRVLNGYAFRVYKKYPWDTNFDLNVKNKPIRVKTIDINTGEVIIYNSLVKCGKKLSVEPKTLLRYIHKNLILKNKQIFKIQDDQDS